MRVPGGIYDPVPDSQQNTVDYILSSVTLINNPRIYYLFPPTRVCISSLEKQCILSCLALGKVG